MGVLKELFSEPIYDGGIHLDGMADEPARYAATHDVSGESRDDGGRWTSGSGHVSPPPALPKTVFDHLTDLGTKALEAEGHVKDWFTKQADRLPPKAKYLAAALRTVYMGTHDAAKAAVRAVAGEWGLDEGQASKVADVLGLADIVLGGKVLPGALAGAGFGPLASLLGAFTPVGSLGALALSSVVAPAKTVRAARKAVERVLNKTLSGAEFFSKQELVAELARRASGLPDFDGWSLCFLAALDGTGDAQKALAVADEAHPGMREDEPLSYAAPHDVSGESRDASGKWTAGSPHANAIDTYHRIGTRQVKQSDVNRAMDALDEAKPSLDDLEAIAKTVNAGKQTSRAAYHAAIRRSLNGRLGALVKAATEGAFGKKEEAEAAKLLALLDEPAAQGAPMVKPKASVAPPAPPAPRPAPVIPPEHAEHVAAIKSLYDSAGNLSLPDEHFTKGLEQLDELAGPAVRSVAAALHVHAPTVGALREGIKRAVFGRRGAAQRAEV